MNIYFIGEEDDDSLNSFPSRQKTITNLKKHSPVSKNNSESMYFHINI